MASGPISSIGPFCDNLSHMNFGLFLLISMLESGGIFVPEPSAIQICEMGHIMDHWVNILQAGSCSLPELKDWHIYDFDQRFTSILAQPPSQTSRYIPSRGSQDTA